MFFNTIEDFLLGLILFDVILEPTDLPHLKYAFFDSFLVSKVRETRGVFLFHI